LYFIGVSKAVESAGLKYAGLRLIKLLSTLKFKIKVKTSRM